MNKACIKCGRIVTVPDIPLPDGYTQKCQSCGFDNPVTDHYGEQPGTPAPSKPKPPAAASDEPEVLDFSKMKQSWNRQRPPASNSRAAAPPRQNGEPRKARRPPAKAAEEAPRKAATTPSSSAPPNSPAPSKAPTPAPAAENVSPDLIQALEHRLRILESRLAVTEQQMGPGPNTFLARKQQHVWEGVAMLCSPNTSVVKAMDGCFPSGRPRLKRAAGMDEVIQQIMRRPYEYLLIDQAILASEKGHTLIGVIRQIPLKVRRHAVIVLLSPAFQTGESQIFYQYPFDLCINLKDIGRIEHLLSDYQQQKLEAYRPLLEQMHSPSLVNPDGFI